MQRNQVILALLLAAVAGFVDAVGYLTLNHLFTAHMSGNSARLGVYAGLSDLAAAAPMAAAVLLFVIGIAAGTAVHEIAVRRGVRATTALLLGVQAVLLAAFIVYGRTVIDADGHVPVTSWRDFYLLSSLVILSIGFQVCALQRVAGRTTRTAYVSGMLTKFTQEAVNWLFWCHDGDRRTEQSYLSRAGFGSRRESVELAGLFGGIWCLYAVGAALGSYTDTRWRLWSLLLPLLALSAAAVADWRRPIGDDA